MFTPAQVAQDVALVASVFEGMIPALQPIVGNNPVMADIQAAVTDLQSVATAFATADATSAPALIQRIQTDSAAVLKALASLPLPQSLAVPMMIAQIMVPAMITAASLLF